MQSINIWRMHKWILVEMVKGSRFRETWLCSAFVVVNANPRFLPKSKYSKVADDTNIVFHHSIPFSTLGFVELLGETLLWMFAESRSTFTCSLEEPSLKPELQLSKRKLTEKEMHFLSDARARENEVEEGTPLEEKGWISVPEGHPLKDILTICRERLSFTLFRS